MRRWEDSTFVFISTNAAHQADGVEERWLEVMRELVRLGARVRFMCLMGCALGEAARESGIEVDPYILDRWNVIRSRSRLRKYLKRYLPVCAHSTGLEADVLLRWAARKVPTVNVAHTLADGYQATRRRRPIEALMRRFDELGMRGAEAVFVPTEALAEHVRSGGVAAERVIVDPLSPEQHERSVRRHLDVYRGLMAERGSGS